MNERWVCKRCFADSEGTDSACQRCGLIRGAEATEADQSTWVAQAGSTTAARPAAWQRLLRFWWIPVVIIALAGGYLFSARRADDGSLASAGNVSIDELRPGDCFNLGDEVEIADVDGVPCTEAHEYEVFALATWEGDGTFPADSQLDAIFLDACEPAFAAYVGEPYASSAIYGSLITPTEGSWADGDRSVTCLLYDPDDAQLTESLRSARR